MPLRFPRPVVPMIATGIAAVWVATAGVPALADQIRQQEWWLGKLDVSQAWQTSRGDGITVAVLSDGVDAAQADLKGSVTTGPNYTNNHESTSTYIAVQGTAIAGLIAGHGHGTDNESGTVGVAPGARILSVRVTLDAKDPARVNSTVTTGLPDAIAAGIRYAVGRGAQVIDLPLDPGQAGSGNTGAIPLAAGGSAAEKAAVAYALSKKVVLVAPAGDDAAGTDAANYPAAYPGVIAVGAFDKNFLKASYSSRQPYVTLTAAGTGLVAPTTSGSYTTVSSTSAASAVVSGMAALIRSRYPSLSPAQVTAALTHSTLFRRPNGTKTGSGYGIADAARAMTAAADLAAPTSSRAGASARPLTTPPAPAAVPAPTDHLTPKVLRAAIVSAAVLVLLLLLIAVYTAVGRRRERKDAAAAAEWARSDQSAYSPYGPDEADRMLEFFAAPTTDPVGVADRFPQYQAAHYQAAQFPARQLPARPAEPVGGAGPGPAGAASGALARGGASSRGVGAWVPLGPASPPSSRQPRVSGVPPWEPAAKPDSELPWASASDSASPSPGPAVPESAPRILPAWPSAAELSPSGRLWEESGDTPAPPRRAMPEDDLPPPSPPPPAGPTSDPYATTPPIAAGPPRAAPSTAAPTTAALLIPEAPAPEPPTPEPPTAESPTPESPAAAPPVPSPGDSVWMADDRPRSPSGTAWETSDSEPDSRPAPTSAAADSLPQSVGGPARWEPAGGHGRWGPGAVDRHWPPAAEPGDTPEVTDMPETTGQDAVFAWRPAAETETFPVISDDQ